MSYSKAYQQFIQDNLQIVDKDGNTVPFYLNNIQKRYLEEGTGRDVILKSRQLGFSSVIGAVLFSDFILKDNCHNVVVAHDSDSAAGLLERVKFYLHTFEQRHNQKVPLKYNSKYELHNTLTNSKYTISTAQKADALRSRTITNLHCSEFAYYPYPEKFIAAALQAVPESGRILIESSPQGFNYFKTLWDQTVRGENDFKAVFYGAEDFYSPEFLEKKKKELGRLFVQEYCSNTQEAFITSGNCFFNTESLQKYLETAKQPAKTGSFYPQLYV